MEIECQIISTCLQKRPQIMKNLCQYSSQQVFQLLHLNRLDLTEGQSLSAEGLLSNKLNTSA